MWLIPEFVYYLIFIDMPNEMQNNAIAIAFVICFVSFVLWVSNCTELTKLQWYSSYPTMVIQAGLNSSICPFLGSLPDWANYNSSSYSLPLPSDDPPSCGEHWVLTLSITLLSMTLSYTYIYVFVHIFHIICMACTYLIDFLNITKYAIKSGKRGRGG